MLADLDLLQPDPAARGFGHELRYMVEDHSSDGLTSYCRNNPERDKPVLAQVPELVDVRIVFRYKKCVIEHFVQPRFDWFEAAKVEAPIVLIEFMGPEDKLECESIAMHQAAV